MDHLFLETCSLVNKQNHDISLGCWSQLGDYIQILMLLMNLQAGDLGWILESEKSPGEGNGYPLQYSCLENPMDRGVKQATDHEVTKSQKQHAMNYFTQPNTM